MIIEEDFLTDREVEIIQQKILNTNYFPWFWYSASTSDDYPFYCHVLKARYEHGIKSDWYDFFFPIFQRFIEKHKLFKGEYEVLRCALNDSLTFKDKGGDPHVDYAEEHLVLILYLTDSSGDTVFYTKEWEEGDKTVLRNSVDYPNLKVKKRVTPKIGKILCYNGLNYHSADWKKENERRVIGICALKGER